MYPHGSTDALPYCTMGSGSLNAMACFEDAYQEDLTREQVRAPVNPEPFESLPVHACLPIFECFKIPNAWRTLARFPARRCRVAHPSGPASRAQVYHAFGGLPDGLRLPRRVRYRGACARLHT